MSKLLEEEFFESNNENFDCHDIDDDTDDEDCDPNWKMPPREMHLDDEDDDEVPEDDVDEVTQNPSKEKISYLKSTRNVETLSFNRRGKQLEACCR